MNRVVLGEMIVINYKQQSFRKLCNLIQEAGEDKINRQWIRV